VAAAGGEVTAPVSVSVEYCTRLERGNLASISDTEAFGMFVPSVF
jgi:hypothetical protein